MANMLRATIIIVISIAAGFILGIYHSNAGSSDPKYSSLLMYDTAPNSSEVTRTAILNTFVEKYKYREYLEIGQGNQKQNHDWIKCPIRIGVDPEPKLKAAYQITSDEFFEINNDSYDLIFIDGLHTEKQVYKDILNSLDVLNENGTIVIHDCNPTDEGMQIVPAVQTLWTGDVWKAWVKLRASRDDLQMYVIDADYGCGVIRKGRQQTISIPQNLDYEKLDRNRTNWLNLVSVSWFFSEMKKDLSAVNDTKNQFIDAFGLNHLSYYRYTDSSFR